MEWELKLVLLFDSWIELIRRLDIQGVRLIERPKAGAREGAPASALSRRTGSSPLVCGLRSASGDPTKVARARAREREQGRSAKVERATRAAKWLYENNINNNSNNSRRP